MRRLTLAAFGLVLSAATAAAQEPATDEAVARGAVARGAYVFAAAGCDACHSDRKGGHAPLSGGRALNTPFGVFYGPNITPDREHGIGAWSDEDFRRALREGVAPDGRRYFPAFPYTSFTNMTDRDIADLKAYLFSRKPVARADRAHELSFPYDQRWLLGPWQFLYFDPGPFRPDPARSAQWNRGAYLVTALGHCGECHTPRNFLGALDRDRWLAGSPDGAEGKRVPNITPDPETGLTWSAAEIEEVLATGMTPEGDFVGGLMAEVVEVTTSKLTAEDRAAIVAYLKALPPLPSAARR